jgi:hypothetical protein
LLKTNDKFGKQYTSLGMKEEDPMHIEAIIILMLVAFILGL